MNKYSKIPGCKQILEDFEKSRGNVAVFLENVTPDTSDPETILFQILTKLRAEPEHIEKWEDLRSVGDYAVATMIHAKLLKEANKEGLASTDMLRVLERLNPETWGRKSMAQQKNARGVGASTKLDELYKDLDE